jgi:outer membrane protein OmpA-like peptidoglycan-associated protein
MTLRSVLLAATMATLPLAASAQPVTGLYVGTGAGINFLQKENVNGIVGGTSTGASLTSRLGPAFVLSLGWGFGNGLRTEVEANYRANRFNSSSFSGSTAAGGLEQKYGAMANVFYDFNFSPVVVPYVGVGVGYEAAKEQNLHVFFPGGSASATNGTVGSFAYQGIAGLGFPILAAPGLAVTAEYRFMGLAGNRNYSGSATAGGVTFPATFQSTSDYNHSILIGVRYNFGQTTTMVQTQAATPAPAAAMARSYLVFFDWDKATLTDRARGIIKDAAVNSTKVSYTKIDVNGYTDTSGTPTYNQGLSVRRAQAVAAELVKDGVPKGAIAISGFGDTHLLVPTGPGVREPQNRRVEIIIK